jgi:hypothetical protein
MSRDSLASKHCYYSMPTTDRPHASAAAVTVARKPRWCTDLAHHHGMQCAAHHVTVTSVMLDQCTSGAYAPRSQQHPVPSRMSTLAGPPSLT